VNFFFFLSIDSFRVPSEQKQIVIFRHAKAKRILFGDQRWSHSHLSLPPSLALSFILTHTHTHTTHYFSRFLSYTHSSISKHTIYSTNSATKLSPSLSISLSLSLSHTHTRAYTQTHILSEPLLLWFSFISHANTCSLVHIKTHSILLSSFVSFLFLMEKTTLRKLMILLRPSDFQRFPSLSNLGVRS